MRLLIFAFVLFLAGCASTNSGLNTIQVNSTTVTFPESYRAYAASLVEQRGGSLKAASVSRPAPLAGETIFDPQRWYSCVLGLPARERPARLPRAEAVTRSLSDPSALAGRYNAVMVFSDKSTAVSVRYGYDSPLCTNVEYESLGS